MKVYGGDQMDEKIYRIRVNLKSGEIEVEGDKEFVKEEIRELIEKVRDVTTHTKFETEEKHTKIIEDEVSTVSVIKGPPKEVPYESFVELYKSFNPRTKQEISLIAIYWLNKIVGKEKVTPDDVKKLLKDASISKPSNIARDMRELASGKKAYLIKISGTSKGKIPEYKISMTGEEYIKYRLKRGNET